MKNPRLSRRGVACAFLRGFAAPAALLFGCSSSVVVDHGGTANAGTGGTACPLPATAEIPAQCVTCIHTVCPGAYADLCAANCGEAELGAPCLNAQVEIGTCLQQGNCAFECQRSHGSPVPGSIGGSGGTGPLQTGGSGSMAAADGGTGGEELLAGAGGAGEFGEGGAAGAETATGEAGSSATDNQCSVAIPIDCGARLNHSTLSQGRANTWSSYSSTQRAESGRETLYAFSHPAECAVSARLKNLSTDLDLLLVPRCDSLSSSEASSTPLDLQTEETFTWDSLPDQTWYVVVDGYAGAEGSYTLEIDCSCANNQP